VIRLLFSQILNWCVPAVRLVGMVHVICVALTTVLEGESSVGFAPTGTFHEQCQFPATPLNENLPDIALVTLVVFRDQK
jgi:hypothetical protein